MALNYHKSGVNYHLLDPIKVMAQKAGLNTIENLKGSTFKELSKSRGETAYLLESQDSYFALVEEGLGTKNLVADEMWKITGKTYYRNIAYDTVAAIVNDLITVGARPLTILAYWAVGDSNWFTDSKRNEALISGWQKACDDADATWGGGETPTLKDIVNPNTIELAGAGFGIIKPKEKIISGEKIKDGDVIIFLESNGIHANGLSLARKITYSLSDGFATKLENGKMYGEELLKPTIIYWKLIKDLLVKNTDLHYIINITGHGWKKLLRAKEPFSYLIEKLPEVPSVLKFIQKFTNLPDFEMYGTFNMGAGFAIIAPEKDSRKIISVSQKNGIKAEVYGKVKKGKKQIIIKPLNVIYQANELNLR